MKKISMLKIISIVIFVISVLFIGYGSYKIYYSKKQYANSLNEWEKESKNYENASVLIEDAENHKTAVKTKPIETPRIEISSKLPLKYKEKLNDGALAGEIVIYRTGDKIPVIEGTEDTDLERGAGHYISSPLPGQEGNSIIFGHRDGAFTELKNLEKGDKILVETRAGKVLYNIYDTRIVAPDDVYITSNIKKYEITFVTCYPFLYIGNAPDRFVVKGEAVINDK